MTPGPRNGTTVVKPMIKAAVLSLASLTFAWATCAHAQDKYQVTDAERAACQDDAIKLCSDVYPNQDALLACMRTNEARLTSGCRPVFEAGLRRRGLR